MSKTLILAIDGPAASGKGTIGRKLSEHYHLPYLDTGSLYRAVALQMLRAGEPLDSVELAENAAKNLNMSLTQDPEIRSSRLADAAATVAAIPRVREQLKIVQQEFAHGPTGAVLDGRDIGTVVCPDADVKLYVTASAEIRANRRWLELKGSGSGLSEAQVLADVKERDARDADRATSPMKPAEDAHLLDTSNLSIEAAFGAAVTLIEQSRD